MMEDPWIIRYYSAGLGRVEYERVQVFAVKEFTPLVVFTGIFLPTDKFVLLSLVGFISTVVYAFYITIFTITCTFATEDFVLWSELFHHTSLMYLGIFIRVVFLLQAQDMFKITRDYVDGVYNYEEGYVDPIFHELKDKSRALQRKLFLLPLFIVGVTGIALGLKPLLDYANEVQPHPALVENGIKFNSLIPIFYPFDNENTFLVLTMNVFLLYFAGLVVVTIIAADLLFIRFYEGFSAIAAPAIGGGFFTCTIVLGLGMIVVNMDDVNISDQIAFTGAVFAELMNAFMISWMSEKIGEQNYELYNAVYSLKWFKWRRDNKKLVITILDGTREPLFLNAFGMAKINMEAFGSVVNTAYSFLNLVNASETLEEKK